MRSRPRRADACRICASSAAADAAQRAAPGDPADAVVWEELIARSGDDSRLTVSFLTLACLIAVVGVVTNSAVTVVGAMVVGPEFAPLAAIAVGLVVRRRDLVQRAALALGALLGEWAGLFNGETVRSADQVDFIYDVGAFSFILALLAGAAGMLSLTSAKSAALVGAFISVTTVPAAAFAVVAVTLGDWKTAVYSSTQLFGQPRRHRGRRVPRTGAVHAPLPGGPQPSTCPRLKLVRAALQHPNG